MITVEFIEQKRYTKAELLAMLQCDSKDFTEITKKLRKANVMKASTEQLDKSELAYEDVIESNDVGYICTFVGLIYVHNRLILAVPKYITSDVQPKLRQVLKVIKKYNKKYSQGINEYLGERSSVNRLSLIVALLDDYHENGLYTAKQKKHDINGTGEVDWDRTIDNTTPVFRNKKPYYVSLYTKKRINNDNDFFTRLHKILLTECCKELKNAGLLYLLDVTNVELTTEKLFKLGDKRYIINKIEKELSLQFNTQKLNLLKLMRALILDDGSTNKNDAISMIGTNSFNIVWEKVTADVIGNDLNTRLCDINANYTSDIKLIDIIEKPKWTKGEFSKYSDKTLIPDFIAIKNHSFMIFDAKYYTLTLEKDKPLSGYMGVDDIIKQYAYQIAYSEFIKANGYTVINCFILPTDEDNIICEESVGLDCFDMLGLERLQIRRLPASMVFEMFINGQMIDVEELKL